MYQVRSRSGKRQNIYVIIYPQQASIGAGGEGATAREVLRHKSVEEVIMVDIDKVPQNLFQIASGVCFATVFLPLVTASITALTVL